MPLSCILILCASPLVSWPSWCAALELNLDACVLDAIGSMRRANASGSVIVDEVHRSLSKFVDRDIGYVDFPSLVLWALEVILLWLSVDY